MVSQMPNLPESLTKLPWYLPSIGPMLSSACRDLFTGYAKIPPDELEAYILRTRDFAFAVAPLATVGEFWFLVLGLSEHPSYPRLLDRLKSAPDKTTPVLIDLGTCLGQDLRKLIHDGAEAAQLVSMDKCAEFEIAGHILFRDAETMKDRFICADIFATGIDDPLRATKGTWEVVASSMLLHCFDWDMQAAVVKKMLELSNGKGSWLIGLLAGDAEEQDVPILPPLVPEGIEMTRYVHNKESLEKLFKNVSDGLKIMIKIQVCYQDDPESTYTKALHSSFFATRQARLLFYLVEIL